MCFFGSSLDIVMAASVKVCGCRPDEGGASHTGGRRTQTSKGGNRGRGREWRGVDYGVLGAAGEVCDWS
jgi:hypothetical protein